MIVSLRKTLNTSKPKGRVTQVENLLMSHPLGLSVNYILACDADFALFALFMNSPIARTAARIPTGEPIEGDILRPSGAMMM